MSRLFCIQRVRASAISAFQPFSVSAFQSFPTGLLNEGFRYRDIQTGTFLTRDPIGFNGGPNLYTYVHQNPWSAYDSEGLFLRWVANIVVDTALDYAIAKVTGSEFSLGESLATNAVANVIPGVAEARTAAKVGRLGAAAGKASRAKAAAPGAGAGSGARSGASPSDAEAGASTARQGGKVTETANSSAVNTTRQARDGVPNTPPANPRRADEATGAYPDTGARNRGGGGGGDNNSARSISEKGPPDVPKNEVFRALREGEDVTQGLRARAPGANTSVSSHVMGKKQSDLISATKDQSKAEGLFNRGHGVVAIDLNKVGAPVIDASQGVGKGRVFSRTKSHQEVLIRDTGGSSPPIPPEAIRVIQGGS